MKTKHVFYLSSLHTDFATLQQYPSVEYVTCGLEKDLITQEARPLAFAMQQSLPFTGKAAQKLVQEMIQLGESLPPSLYAWQAGDGATKRSIEMDDLAIFEKTGGVPNTPFYKEPAVLADAQIAAQKVLLLAWQMEEQALEIHRLEQEVMRSQSSLLEVLQFSCTDEAQADTASFAKNILFSAQAESPIGAIWKQILAATLVFSDAEPIFVATSKSTYIDLQEKDCLQSVTQEQCTHYEFLQNDEERLWSFVTAPAWKVLGYEHEPTHLSWLCKQITLFCAIPTDEK